MKNNYPLIKILFVLNYIIFISSYLYTILINPGIPSKEYYIPNFRHKKIVEEEWTKCLKCNILIPNNFNVTHCVDCDVCVIDMDHHCPWTGKCIGRKNIIPFYIFVITFLGFMIYCIIIICLSNDKLNKKIKK